LKDIKPLQFILEDPERHKQFVSSLEQSAEHQIQAMGSLKGIFIKKAYAAVKSVRPGYINHIIDKLSKDYIKEFAQMHEEHRTSQKLPSDAPRPFIQYIQAHSKEAEKLFWVIMDKYAANHANSMLGKTYKACHSTIESNLPLIFEIVCKEIDKQTVVECDG
jgi:hypothetical protein